MAVGTAQRIALARLALVEHMLVEHMPVRTLVLEVAEPLLAPPLHSTEDTALGPCMPWSRRGKLLFHSDYRHRPQEGSDGRSIVLGLEL